MPRGAPQIEVTFEIDVNGLLKVSAQDKGTGKSESITITNDKGRLTQEDIDRMIKEAEQFADEDKQLKEKIEVCTLLSSFHHFVWVNTNVLLAFLDQEPIGKLHLHAEESN